MLKVRGVVVHVKRNMVNYFRKHVNDVIMCDSVEEVVTLSDIKFTITRENTTNFNDNYPNNLSWDDEQIILRDKIEGGEYDDKINMPYISNDYVCLDGHHRISSLLFKYGDKHTITVKKHKYNYNKITFYLLIHKFILGN